MEKHNATTHPQRSSVSTARNDKARRTQARSARQHGRGTKAHPNGPQRAARESVPSRSRQERINATIERFLAAKEQQRLAREEISACHAIIARLNAGRYKGWTVYEVGETEVSGYTRPAYKAVRATLKRP